jgi:alanine racemase
MRPGKAIIDLNALLNNYRILRELHGGKAFAVLKANAYGHGAIQCAKKLEPEVDAFAVAFLNEGLELRRADILKPILILEGIFTSEELVLAARHNMWIVVHHLHQIELIEQCAGECRGLNVWIKLDTGMHRLGFDPQFVQMYQQRLLNSKAVAQVNFMTHLARADEPDVMSTQEQIALFQQATSKIAGETSICNSAGAIAWHGHGAQWARLGIGMYGANPINDSAVKLEAVMEFKSRIFALKEIRKGEPAGYGGAFIAERNTKIGMVAVGYADGYPRRILAGPILVDGKMTKTVGRVSMDMMAVDLTDIPEAGVGSEVELWGKNLSVNEVAKHAQTISYELLCNVKRVEFCYT